MPSPDDYVLALQGRRRYATDDPLAGYQAPTEGFANFGYMPPQATPPGIAAAMQHQQWWAMPGAAEQLGGVAANTAHALGAPVYAAKDLTERAMRGEDVAADLEAIGRSADVAMGLAGMGTPFAKPGAVGSAGGRVKAYHGSPYDFEKFDIGKIGTGEGAQSYGHGLYFAENEGVAKGYRDQLALAPQYLKRFGGDKTVAIAHLDNEEASLLKEGARPEMVEQVRSIKRDLQNDRSGHMYEVAIKAHPDEFLDWDKPLGEQPHITQKAPQLLEAAKTEAYNRALAATQQARRDELFAMVKDPMKAPAGFAVEAMAPPWTRRHPGTGNK